MYEALYQALADGIHKNVTMELMDVSGLCDLNEKKLEELYDLDRRGMKN